jgi:thiol-disulfide isomerase/thioredoxin
MHAPGTTSSGTAGPGRGRVLWIGGGLVVVIAIVLGLVLAGGDTNDEATAGAVEVGFAETIGGALPPFTGEPDPAVGTTAPTIRSLSMWTGELVEIEMDQGEVNLIGFFAHWCPHCQAELPRVVDYFETAGVPEGVNVWAVSTSVDEGAPNYPPSAWFAREGWPFEVVVDRESNTLASDFGLSGFPFWVAVGPDGHVLERVQGEMGETEFASFVARNAALASQNS